MRRSDSPFLICLIYTRDGYIITTRKKIMSKIVAPKISEILKEEFMIPYHLSAYRLAKEIDVPVSRIQDLLHDRRKITAETSIKLGKFFGLSEKYFLNLQNDIDIREAKELFASSVNKIIPLVTR